MVNLKNRKIRAKRNWIPLILFVAFSAIMMFNSQYAKLPLVGIPVSLAFVYMSSSAAGDVFFTHENRFLKQMLGLATFAAMIALLGAFLILIVHFTAMLSLVALIFVGLGLLLLSLFRKLESIQDVANKVDSVVSTKRESYLLIVPFLLSVSIAFYGLLLARTGEGQISVWRYVPNFFLPVFFVASLSLVLILFFTRIRLELKLALTSVHAFLLHSVFLLVWYPGRYGDTWSYLGNEVFINKTGAFYAYQWLYSQHFIADIIKYQAQYGFVIFLSRMFTFNIYWVHVFFLPLLWSLFVPIFAYKIGKLISQKKSASFPLFCALSSSLFSSLIYWGAISTTFSFGLLLLLFSVMLILEWVKTGARRILFLSLLTAVASLLTHPETGIFALSFFFTGIVVHSRLHRILKSVLVIPTLVAYPIVSYVQKATFSQVGLLSLDNVLSFQLDIMTLLLIFGFLGLVFSIRSKFVERKSAVLLFLFYVIAVVNYYVSTYGMTGVPVPERILTITDILLVPFVGLGLIVTATFLRQGFSSIRTNAPKGVTWSRSFALFLVCLFASAFVTSSLYQAYPRQEITPVQPSAYELEAILCMDSVSEGRYVVLGDTNLAGLAGGLLGIDYSYGASSAKGNYGIPEWDWPNMRLYQQMVMNPSLSVLETAMTRYGVGICYFVVSVREPYYDDIVQRTSSVLQANRTFGEGKLTLFRYTSPSLPITGIGPNVRVSPDGEAFADVQTEYRYLSKNSVKYVATLLGHSSYNITDYPMYWTFQDLTVDGVSRQFDDSSDINTFIFISGLSPENNVEVIWQADDHYPHGGWKEDSFKHDWQIYPGYAVSRISSTVTNDGNIMSISGDFSTQGEYMWYYQSKRVNNISSDAFPYMLVRWKTTAPIASVIVSYNDGTEQSIVPYGSDSGDWSVSIVKLLPNKEVAWILVGITNSPKYEAMGLQTLGVDYVLLCASE